MITRMWSKRGISFWWSALPSGHHAAAAGAHAAKAATAAASADRLMVRGRCRATSDLDDDIFVLHAHRKRLGGIRPLHQPRARLDGDREIAHAHAARIAPRLAGADVVFPMVPRTAQDLPVARGVILAGLRRFHQTGEKAL